MDSQPTQSIVVGSIVQIDGDIHDLNAYKVTEVSGGRARLKTLNPQGKTFWFNIDKLELLEETEAEIIAEWSRAQSHSGVW